jgi:hypothetical protein
MEWKPTESALGGLWPKTWRIAQINLSDKPCAIIRSDGRFGDEFVASSITLEDARAIAAMGVADHLPPDGIGGYK